MSQGQKPSLSASHSLLPLSFAAFGFCPLICVSFIVSASEVYKLNSPVPDTAVIAAFLHHSNWQRLNKISTKATGVKIYC